MVHGSRHTVCGAQVAGEVIENGAAARLVQPGDKIIIAYAQLIEVEIIGRAIGSRCP
jgi:aspartate 1-decarboxylase